MVFHLAISVREQFFERSWVQKSEILAGGNLYNPHWRITRGKKFIPSPNRNKKKIYISRIHSNWDRVSSQVINKIYETIKPHVIEQWRQSCVWMQRGQIILRVWKRAPSLPYFFHLTQALGIAANECEWTLNLIHSRGR